MGKNTFHNNFKEYKISNQASEIFVRHKHQVIEEINKRRYQKIDLPCLWISMISTVKMIILTQAIYRFNAIPHKIPIQFFTDLERIIFLYMKVYTQKIKTLKTILNIIRTDKDIAMSDFKLY